MISYDTNVVVYALESRNQWTDSARLVLKAGEDQGAVLSVLLYQELMTGPVLHNGNLRKMFEDFIDQMSVKFAPVSMTICKRAVELTAKFGKKAFGYDAVLLATAIEQGADTFWTNDKTLLELKLPNLKIRSL